MRNAWLAALLLCTTLAAICASATLAIDVSSPRQAVLAIEAGTELSQPSLNMEHHSGYRAVAYYVNWAIYGRNVCRATRYDRLEY